MESHSLGNLKTFLNGCSVSDNENAQPTVLSENVESTKLSKTFKPVTLSETDIDLFINGMSVEDGEVKPKEKVIDLETALEKIADLKEKRSKDCAKISTLMNNVKHHTEMIKKLNNKVETLEHITKKQSKTCDNIVVQNLQHQLNIERSVRHDLTSRLINLESRINFSKIEDNVPVYLPMEDEDDNNCLDDDPVSETQRPPSRTGSSVSGTIKNKRQRRRNKKENGKIPTSIGNNKSKDDPVATQSSNLNRKSKNKKVNVHPNEVIESQPCLTQHIAPLINSQQSTQQLIGDVSISDDTVSIDDRSMSTGGATMARYTDKLTTLQSKEKRNQSNDSFIRDGPVSLMNVGPLINTGPPMHDGKNMPLDYFDSMQDHNISSGSYFDKVQNYLDNEISTNGYVVPVNIQPKVKDRVLGTKTIEWTLRKRDHVTTEVIQHCGTFYTNNPGYRVQLKAQMDRLHGDIYFSVRLMEGIFDEVLQWPFQQSFLISISDKMKVQKKESWMVPQGGLWNKELQKPLTKKESVVSEWMGPFNVSQYLEAKQIILDVSLAIL